MSISALGPWSDEKIFTSPEELLFFSRIGGPTANGVLFNRNLKGSSLTKALHNAKLNVTAINEAEGSGLLRFRTADDQVKLIKAAFATSKTAGVQLINNASPSALATIWADVLNNRFKGSTNVHAAIKERLGSYNSLVPHFATEDTDLYVNLLGQLHQANELSAAQYVKRRVEALRNEEDVHNLSLELEGKENLAQCWTPNSVSMRIMSLMVFPYPNLIEWWVQNTPRVAAGVLSVNGDISTQRATELVNNLDDADSFKKVAASGLHAHPGASPLNRRESVIEALLIPLRETEGTVYTRANAFDIAYSQARDLLINGALDGEEGQEIHPSRTTNNGTLTMLSNLAQQTNNVHLLVSLALNPQVNPRTGISFGISRYIANYFNDSLPFAMWAKTHLNSYYSERQVTFYHDEDERVSVVEREQVNYIENLERINVNQMFTSNYRSKFHDVRSVTASLLKRELTNESQWRFLVEVIDTWHDYRAPHQEAIGQGYYTNARHVIDYVKRNAARGTNRLGGAESVYASVFGDALGVLA